MIPMIEHVPGYPGLHEAWTAERPYFERAYRIDPDTVARVRFTPIADEPVELGASIPAMPRHLGMIASASLVDAAGQVVMQDGRGLLRAGASFVQHGAGSFDEEQFLFNAAVERVTDLLAFRAQAAGSLLIPPPVPADDPA